MAYKYLDVDMKENSVVVITLNNPENLNALGVGLSAELRAALNQFDQDGSARVAVICGAGRAFSSGGNLREMRESFEGDPGRYMDELTAEVYAAVETVLNIEKPIIASVHGAAYGAAFNLVMACDLAVASEDAVFCESFIRLGLIPGGLATVLLPGLAGARTAADICYTGREIKASEALSLGLVNRVVKSSELEDKSMELAAELASRPPIAVRETKRLLRLALDRSPKEQARDERETQVRMAKTSDFQEGVASFFEKRKPLFKGE